MEGGIILINKPFRYLGCKCVVYEYGSGGRMNLAIKITKKKFYFFNVWTETRFLDSNMFIGHNGFDWAIKGVDSEKLKKYLDEKIPNLHDEYLKSLQEKRNIKIIKKL